jgi:hypothetical protein
MHDERSLVISSFANSDAFWRSWPKSTEACLFRWHFGRPQSGASKGQRSLAAGAFLVCQFAEIGTRSRVPFGFQVGHVLLMIGFGTSGITPPDRSTSSGSRTPSRMTLGPVIFVMLSGSRCGSACTSRFSKPEANSGSRPNNNPNSAPLSSKWLKAENLKFQTISKPRIGNAKYWMRASLVGSPSGSGGRHHGFRNLWTLRSKNSPYQL